MRLTLESHSRAMLLQSGAKMHLVESMQTVLATLEAPSINIELSLEASWVPVLTEEYRYEVLSGRNGNSLNSNDWRDPSAEQKADLSPKMLLRLLSSMKFRSKSGSYCYSCL